VTGQPRKVEEAMRDRDDRRLTFVCSVLWLAIHVAAYLGQPSVIPPLLVLDIGLAGPIGLWWLSGKVFRPPGVPAAVTDPAVRFEPLAVPPPVRPAVPNPRRMAESGKKPAEDKKDLIMQSVDVST